MEDLTLTAGDYRLVLTPGRGGSVSRFDWRDQAIFRPTCGTSILDTACFPLVPFSNRIAHGRFYDGDRAVRLAPNFPGSDHPHPLHGFGWLARWEVVHADARHAVIRHRHRAGEWPWPYMAEQRFHLDENGLVHELSVTNEGTAPMPAGLGLHPYYPCTPETRYHGLHRGEWLTSDDGLPETRTLTQQPIDWWGGQPVSQREVDTVYEGREGPLSITWPDRGTVLRMYPSSELRFTVVYIPADAGFFCVEPVSHETDAVNLRIDHSGLRWLSPDGQFRVHVRYELDTIADT